MKRMKIEYLATTELIPYENNPRLNDGAVDAVAASIKEFGFQVPIVIDKRNVIVAGHTRLKAAEKLGLSEVPCIRADELTDEQVKAFRLADNKVSEFALWDSEKLNVELSELAEFDIDMSQFGFELETDPIEIEEDDFVEESAASAPPRVKRGEVWQLGEHRLMCGDSTSSDDVDRLVGEGGTADIAFASPPYNAGFGKSITHDNGRSKYSNGDNDDRPQNEYGDFLSDYIENASRHSRFNFVNIQILANNKRAVFETICSHIDTFADVIVWDKGRSQPAAAGNVLNSEFELVLVFSEKGTRCIGTIPFHGTLKNIVHIQTGRNEYSEIHNAVFPVAFAAHFVEHFAKESVLDLFGGTGTTLIACEQLGRKCYMMELDPHYCDVIIKRWEDFTGGKAVLVNG